MAREKLITKQAIERGEDVLRINKRIRELKKEFNQKSSHHIGNLYKILTEIVKLKKATNKNYAPRSLEWEEDLHITGMQIRYIFAYKYINKRSKEMINKGLLTDSTLCHFMAISSLLREDTYQNKLVDKIMNNKIRVGMVSELSKSELRNFLEDKLKIKTEDKYFLSVTKTLRTTLKRLQDRKHLLKKSPYSQNMINAIKKLNEFIIENE